MNKPLTMTVKETEAKLVEVCNKSELPLVVLDLIVQTLYSKIHTLVERQTLEEQTAYADMTRDKIIKDKNLNLEGGSNETE